MPVASVRVAVVLPAAPPETPAMDSPARGGVVVSVKLDAERPPAKVGPVSVTVRVAPFRFSSVSGEGLAARLAPEPTVTGKVRVARSVAAVFASASVAVMVTVCAPVVGVVGVPQTSRASVPGQPFMSVPVASKRRPAGRPVAA